MNAENLSSKLTEKGLKVTPQRIAVLEAVMQLHNHPTVDNIIEYIRSNHPNIATATVYKVLDALVQNELIRKVKTAQDIMRYDAIIEKHHHLYSVESDRIEDYHDQELNCLLTAYFEQKGIPGFEIEDVNLHIIGKFKSTNNS